MAEPKPPSFANLAALNDAQLVGLQLHPNDWYGPSVAANCCNSAPPPGVTSAPRGNNSSRMFQTQTNEIARLHALWALNAVGARPGRLASATC